MVGTFYFLKEKSKPKNWLHFSSTKPSEKNFCAHDLDCTCGVDKEMGECAIGNKEFISSWQKCHDFCSGIHGKFQLKCIDHTCQLEYNPPPQFKILKIKEREILVEIAQTISKREKGLSGRDFLPENQGMLFIFEKPDYHRFWMKGMRFALDFIWIREKRIIDITEKVKPEDYQPPKTLTAKEPVDMVLEVNAGFVEKNGIKIGDEIFLESKEEIIQL